MRRREFIGVTATAALGFAAFDVDATEDSPKANLVDVNVSLGRWPFRRLPLDTTSQLATKLASYGVTQAWAGNFAAAFQNDLKTANSQLAAECRKGKRGLFVPFGTVNLQLTGWEGELHRCKDELGMRGLRLSPNYHGYRLSDPNFAKLLTLVVEKKLILQIAMSLEDERTQPAAARVPHVDGKPLVNLMQDHPKARVMLLNWHRAVKPELVKQLADVGVSFDVATVENVGGISKLVGAVSAERVFFGSHAPFFYFESALLKLKESALEPKNGMPVRELNARRWLA